MIADNTLLEAALEYARRGWRVVPQEHGTKKPHITEPRERASSDAEQIRRWWRKWPNAGIGILPGPKSRIAVLDVDIKRPEQNGLATLAALEEKYSALPVTCWEHTPSGGRHYFFKYPEREPEHGWRTKTQFDEVAPGLEILASEERSDKCTSAPSVNGNGRAYEWEFMQSPSDIEPAEMPSWLFDLASAPPPPPPAPRPTTQNALETQRTIDEAVVRYNSDHAREWPRKPGPCPFHEDVGEACFHALKKDPSRWVCESSHHREGGRPTGTGRWSGDALDVDAWQAHRRGKSGRIEHLRHHNYLSLGYEEPPPMEPSEGMPAELPDAPAPPAKASKKQRKAKAPPAERDGLTEQGNADRILAQHGADVLYQVERQKWLVWDGRRFDLDTTFEVERRARAALADLYEEAKNATSPERAEDLVQWAKRSESYAVLQASLKMARHAKGVQVCQRDLDGNPYALNCMNGTIDLRTGELTPHRREERMTKLAPVEYDPNAKAPTWERFLQRIFAGERDMIRFVQRYSGYSATADIGEQCLLILHGRGQNGKSTFIKALRHVLGGDEVNGYSQQAPFTTFIEQDSSRVRTDIARMVGVRMIAAIEGKEGARLDEQIIKSLTGGDTVTARRLYETEFEFSPTGKIWLVTNPEPRVEGVDVGIWRRLRLVPFSVQIPPEERDPELDSKLRAEAPGILSWIVKGAVEWWRDRCESRDGLATPESVRATTAEYRERQDIVSAFVADCCEVGAAYEEATGELYQAYSRWATTNAASELSVNRFGSRMTDLGFRLHRGTGGVRMRIGIRLQPQFCRGFVSDGGASEPWGR